MVKFEMDYDDAYSFTLYIEDKDGVRINIHLNEEEFKELCEICDEVREEME